MRRGYEKVCMAAAVLAMSLSLSACGMDSLVDALGTSGKSQETAGETQEATVEFQGAAAESQEASGETQEAPEESQGAAPDSQEVPERGRTPRSIRWCRSSTCQTMTILSASWPTRSTPPWESAVRMRNMPPSRRCLTGTTRIGRRRRRESTGSFWRLRRRTQK